MHVLNDLVQAQNVMPQTWFRCHLLESVVTSRENHREPPQDVEVF